MRDLSQCVWGDLVSDEERIAFLESGRAVASGIIAPAIVPEIVAAFRCRVAMCSMNQLATSEHYCVCTECGCRGEAVR